MSISRISTRLFGNPNYVRQLLVKLEVRKMETGEQLINPASLEAQYAPAPQRYHAAWLEINARLQSRQIIQATYMSGAVVVMLLGLVPEGGTIADPLSWRKLAVILLPMLSLSVALWVRHNDGTIGLLSAFCQAIERLDDPSQKSCIPGWHETRYRIIDAALKYRRGSDYAFIIVAFIATIPALGLAWPSAWGFLFSMLREQLIALLSVLAALAGLYSLVTVWKNAADRKRIKDTMAFGRGKKGENKDKSVWGRGHTDVDPY